MKLFSKWCKKTQSARWNPAVQVVRVLKCQPNHVHVLESAVQTLGHFHSVFSGEISLGRKGRLYYKTEFSTLWVNVKYYMKPTTMSFKLKKKNDTYMKPASTSFTFEISQHKLWMRNSIKKTSNNKFQIQNIMQKLKMWKIKRHQRLPVSNS